MNKSWEELGKRKSQLEEKRSVLKETAGFFNEVSWQTLTVCTGEGIELMSTRPNIDIPRSAPRLTMVMGLLRCSNTLPSTVIYPAKVCPVSI